MPRNLIEAFKSSDMIKHAKSISAEAGGISRFSRASFSITDAYDNKLLVKWGSDEARSFLYFTLEEEVRKCMVSFFDALAMVYPKKIVYLGQALESEGFSVVIRKNASGGMGETVSGRLEKNGVSLKFVLYTGLLAEFEEKKIENGTSSFDEDETPLDSEPDLMDGREFEVYCANLLGCNGFSDIEITSSSSDQGIDILATKDFVKYGFQCKCYSSDVGNKAVQEAFAGKIYYGCHVAVVLTNRYFTPAAKELAAQTGVVLWDRDKLLSMRD